MSEQITIEKTILSQLIYNEDYARKIFPFIKPEYFLERKDKIIFEEIQKFIIKYKNLPTKQSLEIDLDNRRDLSDEEFKTILESIKELEKTDVDKEWLIQTTEKFCKDKAVYNAILKGIGIIQGKDKKLSPEALPEILTEALAVGFDNHIGHYYIEDGDIRFEFYHKKEEKIEFDLDFFNKITKGGLSQKTLNIALAGTGVGKSLFMCHHAASCLSQSKNVLYITLEMAEEKIAERIDSNLMNIPITELETISKKMFKDRLDKIQSKTNGKLIIKEYPTAAAHAGHFRALINELALKKSFKPDIIFIDYLNICASSRFKANANVGSYMYVKSIAEELRGLAVENDVPIMSATQTTRGGFANSDIDLTDTSESFGLPATADLMFALIVTEELEKLNQIMVKQLKNRYNDPAINKRFVIGVDRSRMKLYDCEQNAQTDIQDSGVDLDIEIQSKYEKFSDFKM